MSGGVDSSVAAFLLKKQGYSVIGIFMKNFSAKSLDLSGSAAKQWEAQCPWERDLADVRAVCDVLDIPHYTLNFEKEYKQSVLEYFFDESRRGRTPNPDVMCNKEIKFKAFLDKALKFDADYIATGHYAAKRKHQGKWEICMPKDRNKDQTYFLYTLNQNQIERTLWPLDRYTKKQVRTIAKKYKLPVFDKPDSQGICFVGEVDMKKFIGMKIAKKPGNIILRDGTVVGKHIGLAFYTIGQREGLGLGGGRSALYVAKKNIRRNELVVCEDKDPFLYARTITADQATWISGKSPVFPMRCTARIRYRQALQKVTVIQDIKKKNRIIADFKEPQRAVTPGQSIVFYQGKRMLGGGVIA